MWQQKDVQGKRKKTTLILLQLVAEWGWSYWVFILLVYRLSARSLKCLSVQGREHVQFPSVMYSALANAKRINQMLKHLWDQFTPWKLHMGILPWWCGWEIINLIVIHHFHSASPHMVAVVKANTWHIWQHCWFHRCNHPRYLALFSSAYKTYRFWIVLHLHILWTNPTVIHCAECS